MPIPEPIPTFDLYAALGLTPAAGPTAVELAWRSAMKRHHPDQAGDDPAATELAKRLNIAHDWLADPAHRRRYDDARRISVPGRPPTTRAAAPGGPERWPPGSPRRPPDGPSMHAMAAPSRTEALLPIASVAVIPLTFALLLGNGPILFLAGVLAALLIVYVAVLLFVGLWTSRSREREDVSGRR